MTRWLVVLVVCLAVMVPVVGQADQPEVAGWKLDSLAVGSGESVTTSGITGVVQMDKNGHGYFELAVQQEQAWINYGRKLSIGDSFKITMAASVGHLQGASWIGPYVTLNKSLVKNVSVGAMWWPALFASEPRGRKGHPPNPESLFVANFGTVSLNVGPVGLVYAKLNYLDDPWNDLPGVTYTQRIKSDFSCSTSVTRDINAKKWMYYIGATWSPR